MKSEQVKGAVEKVAGKAQGFIGNLAGDEQLQAEGVARQAAGQLQQTYGDALETVGDFAKNKPLTTVAVVAGIGLLVGLLLRRR
ncbi:CsbD family protein [Pseudomonas sp. KBS0710]|uniref:CsbD family protein n=1 Tax=Pseudomonas sp. KBS0710 TaxID=1179667 RepID=UPI00110EEEEF|nr:CsbD family protein [Pseudomonas sp. KBS0710]TSD77809.1 CsbD family protein [Pseudomonas sp. KBS0710]